MRARYLLFSVLALGFVFSSGAARAQVGEEAIGSDRHLWAGAEFSDFNPDYNKVFPRLLGYGFYGDYYITKRVGLEGEIRLLTINKPEGQTQKDYLGGPTITVYRYRKFLFNAKVLLGGVAINYPDNIGTGSYFAFAPGGGAEYRLTPKLKLRAEYEYIFLPSAPGFNVPGEPSNGLTPTGFSAGISYKFF